MSYVDLMASDVWTEADIVNRGRALINEQVPEARQDELRTILLGHIAGMRSATPEELAEIALVQQTTEAVVLTNAASRADMALLSEVLAVEAGATALEDASEAAQALHTLRNPVLENEGEQDAA